MSYQTTILADDPLLYYEHEEASVTTATDDSGNGSDGSYADSGVTYGAEGPLEGETSQGVTFDGTDGYMSLGGVITPAYPFCIEAWCKPISVEAGDFIVGVWDDSGLGGAASYIAVGAGGTIWRMGADDTGGGNSVDGGGTLTLNQWQHLFVRFVSATERYLYVDSVFAVGGSGRTSREYVATSTGFYVGGSYGGSDSRPNATISRTAFYNGDVSPARIAEHYRAGILNALTLPMVTAKNMLAASYTWQAEVGAATAEAAKAYVEFIGMAPPANATWLDSTPRAYTWLPNDDPAQWASIGQGTGPALFPSARSIGITLYRKTPASDTDTLDDASVGFLSWVGAIIDDLKTAINAGGTGVLLADSIRISQWYRASTKRKNTEGDHHRVDILIDWYGGIGQ